MAIPLSGCFDYVAVVPEVGTHPIAPWFAEIGSRDRSRLTGRISNDHRLVGHRPRLEIAAGRISLTATPDSYASLPATSFDLDSQFTGLLRANDRLHMVRTQCGCLGVSIQRNGALLAAVGAVTSSELRPVRAETGPQVLSGELRRQIETHEKGTALAGPESRRWWHRWLGLSHVDQSSTVTSTLGSHLPRPPLPEELEAACEAAYRNNWPRRDTWLEIHHAGVSRILRDGEEATVGDYGVFVLATFKDGIPGTDECAAIYLSSAGIRESSVGSAKLLARP